MARRTILVTGSSGRLGAALVDALHRDHAVVQLDARPPAAADQQSFGPVFVGSTTDPEIVAQAVDGVDAVIHCAAIPSTRKPYHELVATNVLGTFNVLEAAGRSTRVEQFVFISSLVWHGLSEPPWDHVPPFLPINEEHPSLAVDYYPCTKVQGEYWCETYVRRFRKPAVIVRPPMIVALEYEPAFRAAPPPDYPYLNDYVGTADLVDGIRRCLDYHPQDGIDRFLFHAADQRSTTPSLDLAARFFPSVPVDRDRLSRYGGFGALIDCAHAEERLGWSPKFRCRR